MQSEGLVAAKQGLQQRTGHTGLLVNDWLTCGPSCPVYTGNQWHVGQGVLLG